MSWRRRPPGRRQRLHHLLVAEGLLPLALLAFFLDVVSRDNE